MTRSPRIRPTYVAVRRNPSEEAHAGVRDSVDVHLWNQVYFTEFEPIRDAVSIRVKDVAEEHLQRETSWPD